MADILSWQDLTEKTIATGLTVREIEELGLKFKPGKDFRSLVRSLNSTEPGPPFDYWALVAVKEKVFRDHLEGSLSDESGL